MYDICSHVTDLSALTDTTRLEVGSPTGGTLHPYDGRDGQNYGQTD